jgi:dUTP pyrophosphatase
MTDKPRKKVMAKPIVRNTIQSFSEPLLHKIATKLVADDSMFIPQYQKDSVSVNLIANIPEGKIQIPHRGTAVIDCGISLELIPGYKAAISATREWAEIGLICSPQFIANGRVKVIVNNIGRQVILIQHGVQIAQMVIEPVYLFNWDLGKI